MPPNRPSVMVATPSLSEIQQHGRSRRQMLSNRRRPAAAPHVSEVGQPHIDTRTGRSGPGDKIMTIVLNRRTCPKGLSTFWPVVGGLDRGARPAPGPGDVLRDHHISRGVLGVGLSAWIIEVHTQ